MHRPSLGGSTRDEGASDSYCFVGLADTRNRDGSHALRVLIIPFSAKPSPSRQNQFAIGGEKKQGSEKIKHSNLVRGRINTAEPDRHNRKILWTHPIELHYHSLMPVMRKIHLANYAIEVSITSTLPQSTHIVISDAASSSSSFPS